MTQMELYRRYSKAAERESAEQFAHEKATNEEILEKMVSGGRNDE